jgi:hypothetical protein
MDAEPRAHHIKRSRRSTILPSTKYGKVGGCVQELQAIEGMNQQFFKDIQGVDMGT